MSRRGKINFLFLGIITIFLFNHGCSKKDKVTHQNFFDVKEYSFYSESLGKWTKKIKIYNDLDTELIAEATYKSKEFRTAYNELYSKVYKLDSAEKNKIINDQIVASEISNEFILSAYIPNEKLNDFNKKDSIWKIYLCKNGDENKIEPVEIREIRKKEEFIKFFYTYTSPWKKIYIIRFPIYYPKTEKKIIENSPFKLIITSVLGSGEMIWASEK
ncbi:MAG: hypothetical protein HQK76_15755 [Desulfobacterales bacterium]|nr:hypothetical protein [Desulfobacterales bacterium]